jgi:hypothetical protein
MRDPDLCDKDSVFAKAVAAVRAHRFWEPRR